MKKGDWIALGIIGIIVILMGAMYFTFYYSYTCDDMACYLAHQEKCSKTTFVNDVEDATWEYFVKGHKDGKCEIDVTVLRIKSGDVSQKRLEGKTMTCLVPQSSLAMPESDISLCHGVLKEELQNLIIQKLHTYILENLGEIGEELQKAI